MAPPPALVNQALNGTRPRRFWASAKTLDFPANPAMTAVLDGTQNEIPTKMPQI
jgi:hypothetical protein